MWFLFHCVLLANRCLSGLSFYAPISADVHYAARLRLHAAGGGRKIFPKVLRRAQEEGHGQPETIALLVEPLLPAGILWATGAGGIALLGAQGGCLCCLPLQFLGIRLVLRLSGKLL